MQFVQTWTILMKIRVITKLPNSERSYKGKVKWERDCCLTPNEQFSSYNFISGTSCIQLDDDDDDVRFV